MQKLKKLCTILVLGCFTLTTLMAKDSFVAKENKNLAVLYTFDKIDDERFDRFVKEDLKKIGFFVNDPHHRVNDAYEDEFGTTYLDMISFSSILNEDVVRPLLNIDPRLGGFSPFNLLNYRKKDDMKTVIAHLMPEAILDILEIDNKEIREKYVASFKLLDTLIEEKLSGKKSFIKLQGLAEDTMLNFEIPFGEPEDIDDFLDVFQEKFEAAFERKGFVIAGFYNIKESFNNEEDVMPGYQMFWSYDLCHIPFSYAIFDGVNAIPEAGVFAPCSMYVYLKEDENKLVIGMPTLDTWAVALGIRDEEKLRYIKRLDKEIPEVLESLGGYMVQNGNPLLKK